MPFVLVAGCLGGSIETFLFSVHNRDAGAADITAVIGEGYNGPERARIDITVPAHGYLNETWRLREGQYRLVVRSATDVWDSSLRACSMSSIAVVLEDGDVDVRVSRGDGWAGCNGKLGQRAGPDDPTRSL
jgi:hypothetical protein